MKNGKTMKDPERDLPMVKEKKPKGVSWKPTENEILRENVKYLRDIK